MYLGEALEENRWLRCRRGPPRRRSRARARDRDRGEVDRRDRDRGSYRWLLARALWAVGRHDAALAAARKAEPELASDPDGAKELTALRAWLAKRR